MAEKSPFKNFGQIGIIVKDIDKAKKNLEDIGIGPFGGLDAEPTVRWEAWGEPTDVKLKMLFTKIGPLEIELIEPISDCMQKEFLDTHGEGIQHYSFFVDDIDAAFNWLRSQGVNTDAGIMIDRELQVRTFVFRDLEGNALQVFERCGEECVAG